MAKGKYLACTLALILGIGLGGCAGVNNRSPNQDSTYLFDNNILSDSKIIVGVVSDLHGDGNYINESLSRFNGSNVDMIILAGDNYDDGNKVPDKEELVSIVSAYASLGVPVFVLPGNHENSATYNDGISLAKEMHNNVYDINHHSADFNGLDIVGLGGYYDKRYTVPNGFIVGRADYDWAKKAVKELRKQNETIILATHSPPLGTTNIDYVAGAGHVGDKGIYGIMDDPELDGIVNVFGHIHEGGSLTEQFNAGVGVNCARKTCIIEIKGDTVEIQVK
jgi:Icc-related predicted phosphoesterase